MLLLRPSFRIHPRMVWYMNLFETSCDDIDQCYEEAMLAGVIPSCLTLLDWHRVDGAE